MSQEVGNIELVTEGGQTGRKRERERKRRY